MSAPPSLAQKSVTPFWASSIRDSFVGAVSGHVYGLTRNRRQDAAGNGVPQLDVSGDNGITTLRGLRFKQEATSLRPDIVPGREQVTREGPPRATCAACG